MDKDMEKIVIGMEMAGLKAAAERVRYLVDETGDEEEPIRPGSLQSLAGLLTKYDLRTPDITATGDGDMCASWKYADGSSLNMEFLEDGVRFLLMYGRIGNTLRHSLGGMMPPDEVVEFVGCHMPTGRTIETPMSQRG